MLRFEAQQSVGIGASVQCCAANVRHLPFALGDQRLEEGSAARAGSVSDGNVRDFREPRLFNSTEVFTMTANTEACHPGEGSKVLNRLPQLAEPLLQFDLREELEQLRREDSWQRETGRSSKTLAKYPNFRIILVLMKAKTQMNEHRAEGRISIHHLLGRICIHLPDQKVNLEVGQLLVLDCGMVHNVEALEESAFLLTVSWPKSPSGS